jgi:hypothetical protein
MRFQDTGSKNAACGGIVDLFQHTYGASSDKHELAAERTEGRGNQFNL